jgi:hypothetical protein
MAAHRVAPRGEQLKSREDGMRRTMTRAGLMAAMAGLLLIAPASTLAAAPSLSVVDFTIYACPASIQSPADLDNAGGPGAVCAVAGQPGDFGALAGGYTWRLAPIEYDLQAAFHVHGTTLTSPEATAGGFCDTISMVCNAFQAYGWFSVPAGRSVLTESTIPSGYVLGWANASADGQSIATQTNAAAGTVTIRPPHGAQTVYVELIDIVP